MLFAVRVFHRCRQRAYWFALASGVVFFCFAGCSGGGGNGGGGGGSSQDTTVTFNVPVFFSTSGSPQTPAVKVQTGSGAFTQVPVQNQQASFIVPAGTTKYQIAYVCLAGGTEGSPTENLGFLIQATTQDGALLTGDCFGGVVFGPNSGGNSSSGSVTGTVDATAVPGAVSTLIAGNGGNGTLLPSNQGPFNVPLPAGTNDVAVIATSSASTIPPLALKIFRGQTAPGAVNGGNTIVLGAANQTVNQPITVNNIPSGTVAKTGVFFHTANGTVFALQGNSQATQYPDVPSGTVQSGDVYVYEAVAELVGSGGPPPAAILQTTSKGGGPVTITLPNAWMSSNPTSIGSPTTITFDYPGFSGAPVLAEEAEVFWSNLPNQFDIKVFATANFQNGANTITFPNPNGSGPIFGCCSSGLSVGFKAIIVGGTVATGTFPNPAGLSQFQNPSTLTLPPGSLPSDASFQVVQILGGFTVP